MNVNTWMSDHIDQDDEHFMGGKHDRRKRRQNRQTCAPNWLSVHVDRSTKRKRKRERREERQHGSTDLCTHRVTYVRKSDPFEPTHLSA